jgi:glycosyltransferase involved in cell wall biosynthesis
MKKKIIHFIYNLGRGGAETMTVRVIKELPEYEHIVVTLFPGNNFGDELQCSKLICINLSSLLFLPVGIIKFRRIIKKEQPHLVHTHLLWPTFAARVAVPRKIPLITTIHAFIATSVEYQHWYIRFLDKLTYMIRKNIIVVVARGAMEEYFSFLKQKPYKAYTLYTFVDVDRFRLQHTSSEKKQDTFRMVAVGALRLQKNYMYLVDAMSLLKDKNIELDIYGIGNLQDELQQQIKNTGAKVFLKGEVNNIEQIVPQYDLFVMASTFEGFSLSVLEAMAMQMPLLLSDNPSFREQCEDNAWYFSLSDVNDAAGKIVHLSNTDKNTLQQRAEAGRQRAINNFTLRQHIEGLRNIYTEALTEKIDYTA